jgi:ferrochelatase
VKTAVVLFNLGGPDSPEAVKPFLFNLFCDKAIIDLPQPLRYFMARYLVAKRAAVAKDIYEEMEGKSPIFDHTLGQARALEKALVQKGEYKVFIAMRYWHPFIKDTVADVKEYNPDKVVLLPLYPQFSTTTSASSFAEWYAQAKKQNLTAHHHPVCCYPYDNHFIDAHVQYIRATYEKAQKYGTPRILFSAHGLPQKVIDKGDPYQWQLEKTVSFIMRKLGNLDYRLCYQSKVGPLKWLEPSTEEEVRRAGKEGIPLVVVPVAFVSEHSETIVELDIECRRIANKSGSPFYARVLTLGTSPEFIASLAWLVEATNLYPNCSNSLGRTCPKDFDRCGYTEWKKS